MANLSKTGPGILKFGETGKETEFAAVVTECYVEPEYDQDDAIAVLSGDEYAGDETEKWTLKFTMYQDYSAESLNLWMHKNSGTEMPFHFVPNKAEALQIKGKVMIRSGKIGGEVKKKNTSEFELACSGTPTVDANFKAANAA